MKAWIYTEYGGPEKVRFEEVTDPEPKKGEVLVRVRASGLNAADWRILRADPALARFATGLRKPRRPMLLGSDVAGEIVSIGEGVARMAIGDRVMAEVMMMGGCGELAAVPAKRIGRIPHGLSFEQAAAIPMAGTTALIAVRDAACVQADDHVLVIGASGGVGSFAVQIARALGAHVTAVCSTGAVDMVRGLGAVEVIDYLRDTVEGRSFDAVINVGGAATLRELRRLLTPRGRLALAGASGHGRLLGPGALALRGGLLSPFVHQRLAPVFATPNAADLETLARMIEAGDIAPVLDRVYPLAGAPEALTYLEEGHPRGKVVVTV